MSKPAPIAFVLFGGASLGAIQVGMLRALYERGVAPDVIVGTSAGALNGAFIASRPQTVETADALASVWRRLRRGQVFLMNPLTGLLGFLGARQIYVLPTGHACALEKPPSGALTMALNALRLLTQQRLINDIERHERDARLIVLPPPCPLAIAPTDFDHTELLIQRGYADAGEFVDAGRADRPPIRMRVHRHNAPARRTFGSRIPA